MGENAKKEEFDVVELFGQYALFTNCRIDRGTVPAGWHCYDVRGSDEDPGELAALEPTVSVNHAGTILSPQPIPFPDGQDHLDIREEIGFAEYCDITLAEFCGIYGFNGPDMTEDGFADGQGGEEEQTETANSTVLPPSLQTLKLYMPLIATLYAADENGHVGEEVERELLDGRELRQYEAEVAAVLKRERIPSEEERGVMHWYNKTDSVDAKVQSVVFELEERDGRLWGVAKCKVQGELDAEELTTLKDYITEHIPDGWGECFNQLEIMLEDGSELYAFLWNPDDWSIRTEQEQFGPELADGAVSPVMGGLV